MGSPRSSDQPLHVAVARLLGYRWPRLTGKQLSSSAQHSAPMGSKPSGMATELFVFRQLTESNPLRTGFANFLLLHLAAFDEHALITAAGLKGSRSEDPRRL